MNTENQEKPIYLRSFGRIKSRTFTEAKQNAFEDGMARFGIALSNVSAPVSPQSLFDESKEAFEMEIGFGSGENLVERAKKYPGRGFIGAEPYMNGVSSCIRRLRENKCDNVRLLNDDARLLLDVMPDSCLRRIFILYPDPWPKARHHKKRLIQAPLLRMLAQKITDDGRICIVTDHEDYARHIADVIKDCPSVVTSEGLEEDAPTVTKYARKADAGGRGAHRFDLTRNVT